MNWLRGLCKLLAWVSSMRGHRKAALRGVSNAMFARTGETPAQRQCNLPPAWRLQHACVLQYPVCSANC